MIKYDAIIFDLGGVLISSPFGALSDGARAAGIDPVEYAELFIGYASPTHPWHECERGEITYETYTAQTQALISAAGHDVDPGQFLSVLETLYVHEALLDKVRLLRKTGYKTAILTNNIAEYRVWWRNRIPVGELFDTVVDSHEVGMRKPDAGIFALTLERLGGIAPQRCLFLDDAAVNIQGAQRAGLDVILVTGEQQAIAALDAALS